MEVFLNMCLFPKCKPWQSPHWGELNNYNEGCNKQCIQTLYLPIYCQYIIILYTRYQCMSLWSNSGPYAFYKYMHVTLLLTFYCSEWILLDLTLLKTQIKHLYIRFTLQRVYLNIQIAVEMSKAGPYIKNILQTFFSVASQNFLRV